MLGRLLYRTLPDQFSPDSTYAWFPLMTPTAMDKILTRLGQKQVYSLKKPTPLAEPMVISGYEDVRAVLRDEKCFGTSFQERVKNVVQGNGCVDHSSCSGAGAVLADVLRN